jgi:HPt (histidine-containing phosphotransfer) domain-containing protein
MDDYLTKPFSDRQRGEALRRWLARRMPCTADAPAQAAPVPATDESAIDAAVIDNIRRLGRKGGPSVLEKVVSQFAATAPSLAATIRTTGEDGDAEGLWRAAHSLKSSAAALGARRLAQRCAAIESRARESGVGSARALVDGVDEEVTAAIAGLRQLTDGTHELAQSAG